MMSHKQIDARAMEEIHRREEKNISVNIETSRIFASLHLHLQKSTFVLRSRANENPEFGNAGLVTRTDSVAFAEIADVRQLAVSHGKPKKISFEISFLRHFDSPASILSPVFFSLESGLLFPPR